MGTIIHFDGREEEVQPQNGCDYSLAELQAIVGEGAPPENHFIEIVYLADERLMVCNEEGRLVGLPRNDKATELAGFASPEERNRVMEWYKALGIHIIAAYDINEPDYIAGTVLVCENQEVQ